MFEFECKLEIYIRITSNISYFHIMLNIFKINLEESSV